MLKFTQRMALGLVNKSEQGFTSVTGFAVQYIEENLAQTIIDQGGWVSLSPQLLSGSVRCTEKYIYLRNIHVNSCVNYERIQIKIEAPAF